MRRAIISIIFLSASGACTASEVLEETAPPDTGKTHQGSASTVKANPTVSDTDAEATAARIATSILATVNAEPSSALLKEREIIELVQDWLFNEKYTGGVDGVPRHYNNCGPMWGNTESLLAQFRGDGIWEVTNTAPVFQPNGNLRRLKNKITDRAYPTWIVDEKTRTVKSQNKEC